VEMATLIVEIVIVGLIAYEIWGQGFLARRKRQRELAATFELSILGSGPDPSGGFDWIEAAVRVNHATEIRTFNMRFVETANGGNVSPEIITVVSVDDEMKDLVSLQDVEGGCDCSWRDHLPRRVFGGKDFKLMILFLARRAWSGYLSFQGWDADDREQYARHPFEVKHATKTKL